MREERDDIKTVAEKIAMKLEAVKGGRWGCEIMPNSRRASIPTYQLLGMTFGRDGIKWRLDIF